MQEGNEKTIGKNWQDRQIDKQKDRQVYRQAVKQKKE